MTGRSGTADRGHPLRRPARGSGAASPVVDQALDRDHLRGTDRGARSGRTTRWTPAGSGRSARRWSGPRPGASAALHRLAFSWRPSSCSAGRSSEREPKRFEITHVPAVVRNRDRQIGVASRCCQRYERITFEKDLISVPGKPLAAFVCPGHPLLDATIDLVLERHRDLLKRGAVLVTDNDGEDVARALLPGARHPGRADRPWRQPAGGLPRLQFVEIDGRGAAHTPAMRPTSTTGPRRTEREPLRGARTADWLVARAGDGRRLGTRYRNLVPEHLAEIQRPQGRA